MAGSDSADVAARKPLGRVQTVLIAAPEERSLHGLDARLAALGFTVISVTQWREAQRRIIEGEADVGVISSALVDLPGLLKEQLAASLTTDRSSRVDAVPLLITVEDAAAFDWDTYASLENVDYVLLPAALEPVLRRIQTSALRLTRRALAHEEADKLRAAVREVLTDIRAIHDPTAMTERLLSGVATVFRVSWVCYWTFNDERMVPVRLEWRDNGEGSRPLDVAPLEPAMRRLASTLWETQAVRDFEVLQDSDPTTEDGALGAWALARNTRPSLALPVGLGEAAFGLLWIVSPNAPRQWSALETSLLQHLVSNVAQALVQAQIITGQEDVVRRLQLVDNAKNEFLITVNHELRTPLTSLTAYVEMIQDGAGGALPPAAASMVQVVERNAKRLGQLVDDVLTVSRLSANDQEVQWEPVNLKKVLVGVVGALDSAATQRGVTLRLHDAPEIELVDGDPAQLRQVFRNLVDNAVKFTPAGGMVDVVLEGAEWEDGMCVSVSVSDTGIGIPDHELPDLFTTFFRGGQAQTDAVAGSGLGLAAVRGLVNAHNGTVTISRPDAGGTMVVVRLPVKSSATPSQSSGIGNDGPPTPGTPSAPGGLPSQPLAIPLPS